MEEEVREHLEYLRGELRAGTMSWGELADLQSLAEHIEPGDVELLEWAGVPEQWADRPAEWVRAGRPESDGECAGCGHSLSEHADVTGDCWCDNCYPA